VPKKYEAIRDKLKSEGKSDQESKRRAAMIYNAQRKPGQQPVSGKHKKSSKRKRRARKHRGGLLNQGAVY
jgi:hypothetical protein